MSSKLACPDAPRCAKIAPTSYLSKDYEREGTMKEKHIFIGIVFALAATLATGCTQRNPRRDMGGVDGHAIRHGKRYSSAQRAGIDRPLFLDKGS